MGIGYFMSLITSIKMTNELYGAGIVNFAHGIMLQDLASDEVFQEQAEC